MLDVTCKGTPYEAKKQVHGSIAFYDTLFQSSAQLQWPEVRTKADQFLGHAETNYPRYYEEMKGIADGAEVPLVDIMALNARSEITFGLFVETKKQVDSDGCTSMALKTAQTTFISQNWDWMQEQKPNLIICRVSQTGTDLPDFQMVTEAGIIGKIGFNNAGVGCCFNAIRARGMDPTRMPIHFGLRTVLESRSKDQAIATLRQHGLAGSAHLLIGDKNGAVGLECSHVGFQEIHADNLGRVCHANNYIAQHENVCESMWLQDSPVRTARMRELVNPEVMKQPSCSSIRELYKDETGLPGAINRKQEGSSRSATLFNVVFDLGSKEGVVTMGRPTEPEEEIKFSFN
ncbi:hypothetical protein N7510_006371 [Penicillium lagena]|uniref:uncharacterized protein n=1 Tax=Penicillium lagena TaxID=94218 RepID=UPI002542081F|nr:uncharacterized protein N7510_006371 [Penicillium lagena]KAJ5613177.1 hypothetical protein N7510_006371 [Penicillium lagena]